MSVETDVRHLDDRVIVSFSGELDMAEVPRLQQEMEAIESSRPDLLVLDLQRLTFIDSSGLRFILESDLRARKESRRVAIVPGPEQVHRIFLIALLDMRLDFIEPDQMETTS